MDAISRGVEMPVTPSVKSVQFAKKRENLSAVIPRLLEG